MEHKKYMLADDIMPWVDKLQRTKIIVLEEKCF